MIQWRTATTIAVGGALCIGLMEYLAARAPTFR
jgi:hypothetical protein